MIKEFVRQYGDLHDALILDFRYSRERTSNAKYPTGNVTMTISRINLVTGKFEIVKLIFSDVKQFRFLETGQQSTIVVMGALIEDLGETKRIDFFPIIQGNDLIWDEESELHIESANFSFEYIKDANWVVNDDSTFMLCVLCATLRTFVQ